ncbi:hypothetical protein BG015_001043 [Linnemannia schmuckeri]|uniref:AAA+ ATPase domain-containing protein n=1 Tax=Linnemannia schmuckeri TaxID=64567 RepID=A0A9P5RSD9_9FUNG|nr:hypothetical protein BG015_001043 [Linnemannia schmuckeri]
MAIASSDNTTVPAATKALAPWVLGGIRKSKAIPSHVNHASHDYADAATKNDPGETGLLSTFITSSRDFFGRMRLRARPDTKKKTVFPSPGAGLPLTHHSRPTIPLHDAPSCKSKYVDGKHFPSLPTVNIRKDVFLTNAPKPAIRSTAPEQPRFRVLSTLQLVFCARLLLEEQSSSSSQSSAIGVRLPDDPGRLWLDAIREDPTAQARIRWLVSKLVAEFLKDPSLGSTAISEVVILGPVLCQADYRALLSCFIERFDQSALLNINLLQGMTQLLQSAPPGSLTEDDLVRVVRSLRERLESTHAPDRSHVYQLVFAVSKVLEVMIREEIKGLNRQRDHQSLLTALRNLRDVDDNEFLKFQVNYAYQTSLYLPDDETSLQALWRYAESVAVGVSAVASVFKLDPMSALGAVEHLQQVAGNAVDVVKFNVDGVRAFQVTREGATQGVEKAYWSGKKQPWFLVLQAAYALVRDGRLVDFNQLVCDAACHLETNFRRGVCLILSEVALDTLWDMPNRKCAIDFLGEFFRDDIKQEQEGRIASWITFILSKISNMYIPTISVHARLVLQDLKQELVVDSISCHPPFLPLPLPTSFPLLDRALDIPYVGYGLDGLRLLRLKEILHPVSIPLHAHPVSIPLHATETLLAFDKASFPLKEMVQEFLDSERLVFLLLGDSGSGKSTFCKQLERELWSNYREGDRIPLLVDLSSINQPENNLIEKQLQQHNFTDGMIQELKQHYRFVLICDGYDESRLTKNIHTTNRFNRPGQWNVKTVITCRNTFLGRGYQGRFHPQGADRYHDKASELFEEAIIAPFSRSDIQTFVEQSLLSPDEHISLDEQAAPTVSECMEKLSIIPNMIDLVTNPFLLTLALKALLFIPMDALSPSLVITTRLQLYDGFVRNWIQLGKRRLERSQLNQETFTAFEHLLQDDFTACVIEFLKRLAEAIFELQCGRPIVEYSHRKDSGSWKARFFSEDIEPTLLREASPLTRAGIRHWFIHTSLLEYFYSLTFYDPNDDGTGQPPRGGGCDSHGRGDGSASNNGSSTGGTDDSTDGTDGSTGSTGGSPAGSNGSTNNVGDSAGGDDSSLSENNSYANGNGDLPNDDSANPGDGDDSRFTKSGSGGGEDDSDENGDDSDDDSNDSGDDGSDPDDNDDDPDDNDDDPDDNDDNPDDGTYDSSSKNGSHQHQNATLREEDPLPQDKEAPRPSNKDPMVNSQPPASADPFARKNLFKEPAVLQFLVERAQLDERFKDRLLTTIEQSKLTRAPSLAAANAIIILLRTGERFKDAELEDVLIPGDYLPKEKTRTDLWATLNISGEALMEAVLDVVDLNTFQMISIPKC